MLPPEVVRIVLLIGLAATAYLLILAWNDDYMQSAEHVEYTDAPSVGGGQENTFAGGDPAAAGSDVPPAITSAESDVPDDSLLVSEADANVVTGSNNRASAAASGGADRLIEVTTPLLRLWIDRLGGDIVRVQLPKFPVEIDRPDVPYQLMDRSQQHIYVAQSGLIGPDGIDAGAERPLFTAAIDRLNVGENEQGTLVLTTEQTTDKGVAQVQKSFRFSGNEYVVAVSYQVDNNTSDVWQAGMFAQIKRDGSEPEGASSFSLGPQPYLGAAITTPEDRYQKIELDDLDEGPFSQTVDGGWVAFLQHYFLSAWIAQGEETNRFFGRKRSDDTYIVGYTSPLKSVSPGATGLWQTQFYAGPKNQKRLEEIAENLNLTVDYGFLWWLAVPLFYLLDALFGLVGNWGLAIVLLTVMVKLVLYPLSNASFKSMARMRKIAPKMKRLQERHADDRQKLSQEMMELYKKEKVNPLGGCLPMLLPMPIFIALYWVLFESVELRHAPFMLWINDLSAMDPYFFLPLAMGATMFLQQQLSPAMGDPMQQRMMKIMPVMFTVLFLFFPAGLVLYWLVNNVLTIAQQYYVIKKNEDPPPAKAAA